MPAYSDPVPVSTTSTQEEQRDNWFSDFIDTLHTHHTMLDQDIAPKDLKEFYTAAITNNVNKIMSMSRLASQEYFVSEMIKDYLSKIKGLDLAKLAFAYTDSEVLAWVEIKDDDWETEKFLIMAEAEINAKYHQYGFDMASTFVETCDHFDIPNHYKILISN